MPQNYLLTFLSAGQLLIRWKTVVPAELCPVVPTRVVVLTNDTVIGLLLGVALLATASSYTVMEIKYHICRFHSKQEVIIC